MNTPWLPSAVQALFANFQQYCESPLEKDFAWALAKFLRPDVLLYPQYEVVTPVGQYRIDFVAELPNRSKRIGFECDGKEFHELRHDEWRDTVILGAGAVEVIYRLRGRDLHYHMEDCLYIISQADPWIFSDVGRGHLEILASSQARQSRRSLLDPEIFEATYGPLHGEVDYIHVKRQEGNPQTSFRSFIFPFIVSNRGLTLEEIHEKG